MMMDRIVELPYALEREGFAVIANVLDTLTVNSLIAALMEAIARVPPSQMRKRYALRDLLSLVPAVAQVAESRPLRSLVEAVLGSKACVVRGLLFDKLPEANWKVAWHQDLTVAVRQRRDVAGFKAWSIKDGVPHVQPPTSVLERMLTLRIHLDDSLADNGPLRVLPGTHRYGRLSVDDVARLRASITQRVCLISRGGVLLMHPLLLHASSAADAPGHRRVIHLEFAAEALPGGLEWQV